jgi:hypothetical protein
VHPDGKSIHLTELIRLAATVANPDVVQQWAEDQWSKEDFESYKGVPWVTTTKAMDLVEEFSLHDYVHTLRWGFPKEISRHTDVP